MFKIFLFWPSPENKFYITTNNVLKKSYFMLATRFSIVYHLVWQSSRITRKKFKAVLRRQLNTHPLYSVDEFLMCTQDEPLFNKNQAVWYFVQNIRPLDFCWSVYNTILWNVCHIVHCKNWAYLCINDLFHILLSSWHT